MKIKKLNIPIYFGKLLIIQYKDVKELAKYKLDINYVYGAVTFKYPKKSGITRYVMAFKHSTPSFIAHEALHCLRYIYEDRGIEFNIDNDENTAYLLGWIVKQCHLFLKVDKETK